MFLNLSDWFYMTIRSKWLVPWNMCLILMICMTLQLKSWWWHDEAMIDWPCSRDGVHHLGYIAIDEEVRMLFSFVQSVVISLIIISMEQLRSWWEGRSWQTITNNSWCFNFRTARTQLFLDQANQNIFNWSRLIFHRIINGRLKKFVNG